MEASHDGNAARETAAEMEGMSGDELLDPDDVTETRVRIYDISEQFPSQY